MNALLYLYIKAIKIITFETQSASIALTAFYSTSLNLMISNIIYSGYIFKTDIKVNR